jgi:hypothetical protein
VRHPSGARRQPQAARKEPSRGTLSTPPPRPRPLLGCPLSPARRKATHLRPRSQGTHAQPRLPHMCCNLARPQPGRPTSLIRGIRGRVECDDQIGEAQPTRDLPQCASVTSPPEPAGDSTMGTFSNAPIRPASSSTCWPSTASDPPPSADVGEVDHVDLDVVDRPVFKAASELPFVRVIECGN